jgi:putative oxidoreductase
MLDLSEYSRWGLYALQIAAGVIFIVHGIPKIKNPSGIAAALGVPNFLGLVHGLAEVVGGLMLIFSFYTQVVALVFAVIMLGAIYFKLFKWKIGFMSQTTTGWEFDFLLLTVFLFLLTH